ncbi:MAG: hypothetical protein O2854_08825 [Chloroflexi bacterium]|nr:hypothetical protein [Chloroflexota bacterium]
MNIDPKSFVLGVGVTVAVGWIYGLATSPMRVWTRALMSGAKVPLLGIVGMTLRGNPAQLLVDAYIVLRKIPVEVSIQEVEVVYIQNKMRASTPEALVRLVQEHLEKKQDK